MLVSPSRRHARALSVHFPVMDYCPMTVLLFLPAEPRSPVFGAAFDVGFA